VGSFRLGSDRKWRRHNIEIQFAAAGAGFGGNTPGGVEMEVVWVGLGTAADFRGRDVQGKAVIVHAMLSPGEMGQSANMEGAFKRAIAAGAGALIGIWGYYDNMAVWQGFRDGSIGQQMASMGPGPSSGLDSRTERSCGIWLRGVRSSYACG
jgi:hypothetical protein